MTAGVRGSIEGVLKSQATKKKAVSSSELTAFCLVPGAGLEPARLAAGDFESPESTNFTTRAGIREDANYDIFFEGLASRAGESPSAVANVAANRGTSHCANGAAACEHCTGNAADGSACGGILLTMRHARASRKTE